MGLIYIPPGHVWVIEMAVAVAHLCFPERWEKSQMLPGEDEIWNGIVTGRYKSEAIHAILCDRYRDQDWSVLTPQTARFFAFDQALETLRTFIAEGAIFAKFVDEDNQGKIDHIKGESLRTKAGVDVICRGYAHLADSPRKKRYLFVQEDEVVALLRKIGALRYDPDLKPASPIDQHDAQKDPDTTRAASIMAPDIAPHLSDDSSMGREPKVKQRRDYDLGTPAFLQGLRTMGVRINAMKADGTLPASNSALAKTLARELPELEEKVGKPETLRQIIADRNKRANRLADKQRTVAWWPIKRG